MTSALASRRRLSSTELLARVLDTPELVEEVRTLPPAVLLGLVERVGLEDAGELVSLATTEQLAAAFDEDLWKNTRPGEEEDFDDARFVLWLEVLLEAGDAFVAARLGELSEDFVALALHRRLLVIPLERLAAELEEGQEDAFATEKLLSNQLSEEFDEFVVIARESDGWDSVLAALLALDRDQHEVLARLLERLAALSDSFVAEQGGLYAVLSDGDALANDVAAEREDRRAALGYVAPRAASAFLELARAGGETPSMERDPITRAYFRDLDRTRAAPLRTKDHPTGRAQGRLARVLAAAGVIEGPRRQGLPRAAGGATEPRSPAARGAGIFLGALHALEERDGELFEQRSEELAYLANVLVAGATCGGRRVRPVEAIRAAVAICERGLLMAMHDGGGEDAALRALTARPADALFRLGFEGSVPARRGGAPDIARVIQDERGPFERAAPLRRSP